MAENQTQIGKKLLNDTNQKEKEKENQCLAGAHGAIWWTLSATGDVFALF